jgi:glycogen debranching enzyme
MSKTNQAIVAGHIETILPKLKSKPKGCAKYPYLNVVWGDHPYNTVMFGWDAHFIALRLAAKGEPEWLKYHTDNFLELQDTETGFISSLYPLFSELAPSDADTYYPLMAQGILVYGEKTGDMEWVRHAADGARRLLGYYEKYQKDECGLFFNKFAWTGCDNDISIAVYVPGTVCSPWINSLIWLEYRAMVKLGVMLGDADMASEFTAKEKSLQETIERLLWSEEDSCYAQYIRETKRATIKMEDELLNSQGVGLYSFLSFTNLTPLYAGLADRDRAKLVIDKYLSSKDHFLSDWGIRSLSKSSEFYNNAIWGNPPRFECPDRLTNSNWQGPVWVLCTYFMFHALLNYGYTSVAREAIDNLNKTLAADITNNGMMNENYDAENGRPLYASNFGSWNVLADLMPEELKTGKSVCDVFMK